ncbi:hypothetical protein, membrane [gut metagenome]|uniref:Uncharacterized protein n=1 Tax=gut metagenome TaxID=749906 RepID=J9GNX9_9ZZZZ
MKQKILFYLITLLAYLPQYALHAQHTHTIITGLPQDSVRFSLLTCDAGEEIYTLFGHTAIRYENLNKGIDVVFNYGMFSFQVPHFALRFALGETDYQLGLTDFRRFAAEYQWNGRKVWQQTLNLTDPEKKRLWTALTENYLPQNRVYRYNFFYDNCATRPRDQIEHCVEGKISYQEQTDSTHIADKLTWRDLLHHYTAEHPWSRFGIDLCIGSAADRTISLRERMFIPFYVQEYFKRASILSNEGESRKLVSEEKLVVKANLPKVTASYLPTPLQTSLLFFMLVAYVSIFGLKHRYSLWGLDTVLFATAGVIGCIITFLVLFSTHPAVSPNWLLWIFHPFHLLCLPVALLQVKRKRISRYMAINTFVLTLFILLFAAIPQFIPPAVVPLALCLLIRSACNLILSRKTAKKNKLKAY